MKRKAMTDTIRFGVTKAGDDKYKAVFYAPRAKETSVRLFRHGEDKPCDSFKMVQDEPETGIFFCEFSTKADEYLSKVGVRPGAMKFTFNAADNSFTVQVGSLSIPGTYKVGSGERTVNLTFGKSMQFLSMTGTLESSLSGARMLFTADKAMAFIKKLASMAGQSSSEVSGIAKLAEGYDNYRIGFKLSK